MVFWSQIVADALWLTTTEYEEESESHTKLVELAKEMLTEGVVSHLPVPPFSPSCRHTAHHAPRTTGVSEFHAVCFARRAGWHRERLRVAQREA